MKISKEGIRFLTDLEGVRLKMYRCEAGLPTIGVGHLLKRSELSSGKIKIGNQLVKYAQGLTEDQAATLLTQDLSKHGMVVSNFTVPGFVCNLEQHQFDALVSFCFNVGINAYKKSTLVKRIKSGDSDDVPNQLMRWVYVAGTKSKGLTNRRKAEVKLWSGT